MMWTNSIRRTWVIVMFTASASLAAGPSSAAGQDGVDPRSAIDALFEGMRQADARRVRSVLAPDARFALLDGREGAGRVRVQSVDAWVDAISTSGGGWDEQTYDVEVKVDGAMASIWAPYTFYLNGAISHCGVNSIELLHDAEGWKITQISDTRTREECPDPLGATAGW